MDHHLQGMKSVGVSGSPSIAKLRNIFVYLSEIYIHVDAIKFTLYNDCMNLEIENSSYFQRLGKYVIKRLC